MKEAMEILQTMDFWCARIANPLPVVLVKGEGVCIHGAGTNAYVNVQVFPVTTAPPLQETLLLLL